MGARASAIKPTVEPVLAAPKVPAGRPLAVTAGTAAWVMLAARGAHSEKSGDVIERIGQPPVDAESRMIRPAARARRWLTVQLSQKRVTVDAKTVTVRYPKKASSPCPTSGLAAFPQVSYWMWTPEIARLMISRWISLVPSKIV